MTYRSELLASQPRPACLLRGGGACTESAPVPSLSASPHTRARGRHRAVVRIDHRLTTAAEPACLLAWRHAPQLWELGAHSRVGASSALVRHRDKGRDARSARNTRIGSMIGVPTPPPAWACLRAWDLLAARPTTRVFLRIGPFSSVGPKFEATAAPLTASEVLAGLSTRPQLVHFSTAESGALFGCP